MLKYSNYGESIPLSNPSTINVQGILIYFQIFYILLTEVKGNIIILIFVCYMLKKKI